MTKLAVLGDAAHHLGAITARRFGAPELVTVAADDALTGGEWLGVLVSGDVDGAARLARAALASGVRVLVVSSPAGDDWLAVAGGGDEGLTLSRPLRVDPHIARARQVVDAGSIGVPRTLDLGWSFGDELDVVAAAGELVDVACCLLGGTPAALSALASEVAGPPLIKVNLLAVNGGLATIEAAGESADLPTRRDLHLIATDGEIVHRIGHDDLLWSDGRVAPLPGAAAIDDLRARELAAWIAGDAESARLARGAAVAWNLAAARALSRSLATGEMVSIEEEVSGS